MPVYLRPREDRRLRGGHLWVFSNEILRIEGDHAPGDLVSVFTADGRPIGSGLYHPGSLIAVRMIGPIGTLLDIDWYRARVGRALRLRRRLYPGSTTYRLVHAESDALPGVVVDRFDTVCAVQIASTGMELRRELLFDALMEIEGVTGIVERNDTGLRGWKDCRKGSDLRGARDRHRSSTTGCSAFVSTPLEDRRRDSIWTSGRTVTR